MFPKPTGQYAVGAFTYTVYDDREEVLPAGGMQSLLQYLCFSVFLIL